METQEFEEQEEQVQLVHSPAAVITLIVLSILFLLAIIFFGYQTWGLVDWVLPAYNFGMKVLAVVMFDVFSYVWLAVGLFLRRWIQPLTQTLAVIAGIVTFLLSLGCSIVQLAIADVERFGANSNPNYVYVAEGFIIIAVVWNIATLLAVVHIQWPYISGYHPPKRPKNKRSWFGRKRTDVPQIPQPAMQPDIDYVKLAHAVQALQVQQHNGHTHTDEAFPKGQSE